MKRTMTILAVFFFLFQARGQTTNELAVRAAVENLRKAMIDADSAMLDKLTDEKLSYGHSGGTVEGKREFISKILSGKSKFISIELTAQTISISKNTAIVRHHLNAVTNDNGKAGEVHLLVLLVWQKKKGNWTLLARQAVKAV